jgi:hypothetical protein
LICAACRTALVRTGPFGYSHIIGYQASNAINPGNTMKTTPFKTACKTVLLLGFVALAMAIVAGTHQGQAAQHAPLMLSQASMLLPTLG